METPADSTAAAEGSRQPGRNSWTLVLILMVVLAAASAVLAKYRDRPQSQGTPAMTAAKSGWTAPSNSPQKVLLAIDFGNGARREFAALPWSPGMTVADVLKQAADFRPGIAYDQQGAGEGAFLTSLDGVRGDAEIGRFWIYEINGKSGEISFELAQVGAGDRVLWAFKQPE